MKLLTAILAFVAAAALAGSNANPARPTLARAAHEREVAQPVDFQRDIQPILAGRCTKCHSGGEAEAGLRLTESASAFGELESGHRAIVAGQVDASELLRRVASTDAAERMPPEGPPLSAEQIDLLRRWIAAGADWPDHWAYQPLGHVRIPECIPDAPREETQPFAPILEAASWPLNPIDAFIAAKLAENDLAPSPPADRRTLLRRVYFDLIGLPPTPHEFDAFLADDSPLAYERVVDRLLASPHYGERWARHWMDVVHYAETHGHDQDRPRDNAWPYRDYLIRSFNDDKPYARFVQEQVAGDVLYPGDPQALVGTGFLATGPWDESSLRDIREDALDREIGRYLDRDDIVTTVMSTFASSTVHCARCHDHKFDPITQKEYYGLQAVFAATDKANRAYDPDPLTAARRGELAAALADLPRRAEQRDPALLDASLQQEVARWEEEVAAAASKWQTAELVEFRSGGGAKLRKLDDGSLLAGGEPRPDKDVYTLIVRPAQARVTGLRLEVLPHPSLPMTGPGRQDNGNLHLNELRVWAMTEGDDAALHEIELKDPVADFNQEGWSINLALDGNPNTAWGIFPEIGKPHQAVFQCSPLVSSPHAPREESEGQGGSTQRKASQQEAEADKNGDSRSESPTLSSATLLKIELSQIHGGGHLIGCLRISTTDAEGPLSAAQDAIAPAVAEIIRLPREQRSDEQRIALAAAYLNRKLATDLAALPPPQLVYCGTNRFTADGTFRPSQTPRVVHVLHRGEISQPREEAQPGALGYLSELPAALAMQNPADEGQRRAALARWLTDRANAITWRSIANRVWHYHFGRGIVDTPSDFGRMGGVPSHAELLDWLAGEMRNAECGMRNEDEYKDELFEPRGSIKSLHRLIVTSVTYRQSSRHHVEYAARDADNGLLWRMNRRRLDAESLRDAALYLSGTLDATMGGPSVKQFIQTPGVHVTPNVDYQNFSVDDPGNCRRSVYRFVFRTLPDPFMDALDCPDASQLTPQRSASLTALQALALLNDKLLVQHSEHLAERVAAGGDVSSQVEAAYRLVLGRAPTPRESAAVEQYAAKHGLANACRFLLNSNEFVFVD